MIREEDLFEGFTIGEWEVLPAKGLLRRGDAEEHPEPKVLEVLIALARRNGNLITKDELINEVWEGRAFDDQPIQRAVALLRKHLQDTKPFQYIETLQRRGYRLIKPVQLHNPSLTSNKQSFRGSGRSLRRWTILAGAMALGLIASSFFLKGLLEKESLNPSIAVLPFENMTGDPGQEFFSDGLSEELLNMLVQIPGLTVVSRSSSFSYKGKKFDIPTIATQLSVTHVLEGSVRSMGDRVRVTAQLIEASTDSHLWSKTYERELEDIFAIQDDIARSVASELRVTLFGRLPNAKRTNTEAYSLFLQAQYLEQQGTSHAYSEAILLLRRALAIDDSYAPAWSALSRILSTEVNTGLRPVSEGIKDARFAAQKALELDPTLASARVELARIAMTFDLDFAEAIEQLNAVRPEEKAIEQAAVLAQILGLFDLAADWGEQAIRLDPVSPSAHIRLAVSQFDAGRFDDAERTLNRAILLSPGSIRARIILGIFRLAQGKPEEAMKIADEVPIEEAQIYLRSMAAYALDDLQLSDKQIQLYIQKFADESASGVATIYAFRNQPDLAFQWLERAYENRDNALSALRGNPLFRNLDDHTKMQPFLSKLGLSDEQIGAYNLETLLKN